jgi:hypothetical protein
MCIDRTRHTASDLQRLPRALRAVLALALFAVAGPPLGGIVAWLVMGSRSLSSPIPFLIGSYGEAAVLAFCVGGVVVLALLLGKTSGGIPLTAALIANVLMFAQTGVLTLTTFDAGSLLRVAYVFIPPSLVATFICWALARRLLLP